MQHLKPESLKRARILVVEDNSIVARDLELQIEEQGYECVGRAAEGEHAIRLAGELRPDLVLMDVQLDGEMDGITAAQAIHEQFALPVVFLTAFTANTTVARATLTDPFGYIIKPFREQDLHVGIEMALYKSRIIRKLQASEERHRTILQAAMDGFWLTDPEGRLLEVNAAYCRMSGYSPPELLALRVSDLEAVETADHIACRIQEIIARGEDRFESRHRRKDGSIFDVEISVQYRPTEGGQLVCFLRDITTRKKATAEREGLAERHQQLQKSESLGRMAGAIAHHFNNQLQAVMLNLEMARSDLAGNADIADTLAEALQSARKAANVTSLMLTYLGQTGARQEPIDLSAVCQRQLPLLQASIPRSVVWETDLPTPGPTICANMDQIQQVLNNLLANAWEALSGARGSIRLSIKTVSAADIPGTHRFPVDAILQANDHACLEVADTGCGIAAQDIEKIFDPFFSHKFIGRGMGLSIVLGIVRAHRGVVTVESQPGRGSVFRVFLPVSAAAVPRTPLPVVQTLKPAGGITVLLVEDESEVRKVATVGLKRLGYAVIAAQDGVEALELFRQRREEIRCVLCDLTMPRMDGWETLTALRQIAPGMPVVLASGYSKAQVMEGDHPEQPQVFLSKPYNFQMLGDAIGLAMTEQKALN